jgi:adhesin HecA-like repeat protein
MKKLITAVLGGTAVATLAFASASMLDVDGGVMQTGTDTTLYCQDAPVKVDWGYESKNNSVYFASVSGIEESCYGADLNLRTNVQAEANLDGIGVANIQSDTVKATFKAPIPAGDLEWVTVTIGK